MKIPFVLYQKYPQGSLEVVSSKTMERLKSKEMYRAGGHDAMANQQHLNQLKLGVGAWNEWRREHLDLEPDLSYAALSGEQLPEINLFKANLQGADLSGADLSGADLTQSGLQEANLLEADLSMATIREADLQGAHLMQANLKGADLHGSEISGAYLTQAMMQGADLDNADLLEVDLSGADLQGVHLIQANLHEAILSGADLRGAHLIRANLQGVHFDDADLREARLDDADLRGAHLIRANLQGVHFDDADLREACLDDADLRGAHLIRANLQGAEVRRAFFDTSTRLDDIMLGDEKSGSAFLADISWGDVNLSLVDWAIVKILGDELQARQTRTRNRDAKENDVRLKEYRIAVRANRQLASALRDQGMNDEATPFAYKAQVLQRRVFLHQVLRSYMQPATKRHLTLGRVVFIIVILLLVNLVSTYLKFIPSIFVLLGQVIPLQPLLIISSILLLLGLILPKLLELESQNQTEDLRLSLLILIILLMLSPFVVLTPLLFLLLVLLALLSKMPVLAAFLLIALLLWIYRMYMRMVVLHMPGSLLQMLVSTKLFEQIRTFPPLPSIQKIMRSALSQLYIFFKRLLDYGRYTMWLFLDMLAGYGYKPVRSLLWYMIVISVFALAYHLYGNLPLFPPEAFVYSLTSFHGRGFLPGLPGLEHRPTSLNDPLVVLAALEAIIGLFIEISFIATFTQRYFGK
jgi:uncharacterized protein YjbI with pentapeptide repeats